jgi:hypothetical protein
LDLPVGPQLIPGKTLPNAKWIINQGMPVASRFEIETRPGCQGRRAPQAHGLCVRTDASCFALRASQDCVQPRAKQDALRSLGEGGPSHALCSFSRTTASSSFTRLDHAAPVNGPDACRYGPRPRRARRGPPVCRRSIQRHAIALPRPGVPLRCPPGASSSRAGRSR